MLVIGANSKKAGVGLGGGDAISQGTLVPSQRKLKKGKKVGEKASGQ